MAEIHINGVDIVVPPLEFKEPHYDQATPSRESVAAIARSTGWRPRQCVVPEIREQSLCSFSRIESAVAVQMNGAVFLL